LAGLLLMIDQGTISGKIGKTVFEEMVTSGKDAETIVREKNLVQMSDTSDLELMVQEIIAANPAQAADFKAGKTKLMGFFVGQLMARTQGRANPKMANDLFTRELNSGG
jgi:aspartyl-tRNA(Asn)/glutamyl-tRNA(Gln) amidotransferase subunit B